jgi:hypothetical protein
MRWSVSLVAEGDRVMSREEIVALADAVAPSSGIASGIGTMSYGAQLVVEAETGEEAVDTAVARLREAAQTAGLPDWPVARAETIGEDDDLGFDG